MAITVLKYFILFCSVAFTVQTSCSNGNQCNCDFSDESTFKSKSEYLAAAVGALGPMLAVGGGFGIWKLVTSKLTSSPGEFSRETSDLSESPSRRSNNRSPATNSTRASSRVSAWSRSTALTLNDMDAEIDDDLDFRSDSPTPKEGLSSPAWSNNRKIPPSVTNRAPAPAQKNDVNSWMF
ncbi:uncharacterized protein LOC143069768 [Mytilus galloprovincialis]|uniref:uncharacterized protein LOC143069768 n=1 Tax=Mytilus galloprovincialis TaxID=29158 RepID=UPI003F7C8228